MADLGSTIFSEKATQKLRSPDDLDKYLQVANPGRWVLLLACIALALGLVVWAVFGAVSTNVSCSGAAIDGKVLCFLDSDEVGKVSVGDRALVQGQSVVVASVDEAPISRDEAHSLLDSDYLVDTLFKSDWAYTVELVDGDRFEAGNSDAGEESFDGSSADGKPLDLKEGVPLNVSITTESVSPASLVIGKFGA